jgi:hypothetical protein
MRQNKDQYFIWSMITNALDIQRREGIATHPESPKKPAVALKIADKIPSSKEEVDIETVSTAAESHMASEVTATSASVSVPNKKRKKHKAKKKKSEADTSIIVE